MKIVLIKQVFIDKAASQEISLSFLALIHPILAYSEIAIYPALIFLALT